MRPFAYRDFIAEAGSRRLRTDLLRLAGWVERSEPIALGTG